MLRLAISDAQFLQGVSQTAKSAFVQLSWVVSMAIRRPCTSFLSVMRRQNSLSYGRRRRVLEKAKKSFDAGDYRWGRPRRKPCRVRGPVQQGTAVSLLVSFWHLPDIDAGARRSANQRKADLSERPATVRLLSNVSARRSEFQLRPSNNPFLSPES
jgi:hypothetical protein